jgi:outer membrane protein insertion porin family
MNRRRTNAAEGGASREAAAARRWRLLVAAAILSLGLRTAARAVEPGPPIEEIRIDGNQRVEEEAIRVHVKARPGEPVDPATVDQDVRAIYGMGFFEDVQAEIETVGERRVLVYRVKERPLLRDVKIEGNRKVSTEDLETALKVRPRTILDLEKVHRGIEEARKLYDQKGYKDARIDFEVSAPDEKGEVVLTFKIDEGKIVRIEEIVFEGNQAFSAKQLKRLLQTKEKWMFSWLTGAGTLDPEVLKTDVERLTAFYYDNGYVNVRIDEPEVTRRKKGLLVRFRISEGKQYRVGQVGLSGDVLGEAEPVVARLETKTGEVFRASRLRKDVFSLTEAYGDLGYAFVNVEPLTQIDPEKEVVDVSFKIDKGPQVYFDRIEITGNTKTRDEVIRRELAVQEQQRFSGSLLRASRERVQRLGFFQDVNMTTQRSSDPDKINLLIDVKEGQTGAFTAGAGFSSADRFLFNVRLSENNLFGSGDSVALNADLGSIRQNFTLDYVDTYFLDTYFTMTFSGFNFRIEFDDFTRKGSGFSVQALYPFVALGYRSFFHLFSLEEVRFGLEYKLEQADIGDLSRVFLVPSIVSERGTRLTSSLIPTIVRNTLNHPFDPTAGSVQNLSVQFAGLGGDADFLIAEGRARWFYPFYRSPTFGTFVASTGGRIGWGIGQEGRDGREIPLFERFFPGGINSVRGFRTRTLGPREPVFNAAGQVIDTTPVGGSTQLIVNNELIFPIVEPLGLRGVLFVDMGNAWRQSEGIPLDDLRYAAGWGFRWLSPIGPLRIEIGYPLDRRRGERSSVFLFSFGAPL